MVFNRFDIPAFCFFGQSNYGVPERVSLEDIYVSLSLNVENLGEIEADLRQ